MDKLRKENESFWWITQFLLNLIHVNPCLKRRRYIYMYRFQLRYLEVLGSIFTCTIMFRYTFGIPFPANTPKWSFSVLTQWTGGVTVVFSCLALVYVWKLRINAGLSNCRSIDILKCSVVYLPVHLCSCSLLEKPDRQTHL